MDSSIQLLLQKILTAATQRRATYVHFTVGAPPVARIGETLVELGEYAIVDQQFMERFAAGILEEAEQKNLSTDRELIVIREFADRFRCKITLFYQKDVLSAWLKLIPKQIPALASLGLPATVSQVIDRKGGLVIVCGPYGSGRTTTIAALLEEINTHRSATIVTIEKPIEYFLFSKKSIVEQREVGRDATSFAHALEQVADGDVDVVAVGANTEPGVIPLLFDNVSAGRLAFFEMHTTSIVQTLTELISTFPADQRERARLLLAEGLAAIVCQRLIPKIGGGVVVATEIAVMTEALRGLVRDNRIAQIMTVIQSSRAEGMMTLDQSLVDLATAGAIGSDQALMHATDRELVRAMLKH